MGVVYLFFKLFAGDFEFVGIYDHDKIAAIQVRCIIGLVFADQDCGNPGTKTSQGATLGIDQIPLSLNFDWSSDFRFHKQDFNYIQISRTVNDLIRRKNNVFEKMI